MSLGTRRHTPCSMCCHGWGHISWRSLCGASRSGFWVLRLFRKGRDMAEKWRGPIPKPTSTKKKKAKANTGGKTVNMALVEEKRRRINNTNRARGKATEREVAKRMDGIVVPLSGAVKNSVMNLEGDVQIRDLENKDTLFVIECKNSSTLTPKGDRSFTLKRSVVEQAFDEAEIQHAIGILRI